LAQNILCVHSAHAPEPATGALSQSIYLTTTFERGADDGYPRGYRYSREGTPTAPRSKPAAIAAANAQLSAPAIAALAGVVLFAEPITLRLSVSSVLVLGGTGLAVRRRLTFKTARIASDR
jgi:cystathionine beta-lyase/cystathionine gamma-synthase